MTIEQVASVLTTIFCWVGLVVCLCCGLVACARLVVYTLTRLRFEHAVIKHERAVTEAIAEWVDRNPQRAEELARLRKKVGQG